MGLDKKQSDTLQTEVDKKIAQAGFRLTGDYILFDYDPATSNPGVGKDSFADMDKRGAETLAQLNSLKGHQYLEVTAGLKDLLNGVIDGRMKNVEALRELKIKELSEAPALAKAAIQEEIDTLGKRMEVFNKSRAGIAAATKQFEEGGMVEVDGVKQWQDGMQQWNAKDEELKPLRQQLMQTQREIKALNEKDVDFDSKEFQDKLALATSQEKALSSHDKKKEEIENTYKKELRKALPKDELSGSAVETMIDKELLSTRVSDRSRLREGIDEYIKKAQTGAQTIGAEASEALGDQILTPDQEAKFAEARKTARAAEQATYDAQELAMQVEAAYIKERQALQSKNNEYQQNLMKAAGLRDLLKGTEEKPGLDPTKNPREYNKAQAELAVMTQEIDKYEDAQKAAGNRYRTGMFAALGKAHNAMAQDIIAKSQLETGRALVSGDEERIELARYKEAADIKLAKDSINDSVPKLAQDAGHYLSSVKKAQEAHDLMRETNIQKFVAELLKDGGTFDKAYEMREKKLGLNAQATIEELESLDVEKRKFKEKLTAQAGALAEQMQYVNNTIEKSDLIAEDKKPEMKRQALLAALNYGNERIDGKVPVTGQFAANFFRKNSPELAPVRLEDLAKAGDRAIVADQVMRVQIGVDKMGNNVVRIHQVGDGGQEAVTIGGKLADKLVENGFSLEGARRNGLQLDISSKVQFSQSGQLALHDTKGRDVKLGVYDDSGRTYTSLAASGINLREAADTMSKVASLDGNDDRFRDNQSIALNRMDRGQRREAALAAVNEAKEELKIAAIEGRAKQFLAATEKARQGDPRAIAMIDDMNNKNKHHNHAPANRGFNFNGLAGGPDNGGRGPRGPQGGRT